ncbi:MAG: hypothetical protein ACOH1P_10125 [Lysobacter sp.]
MTRDNDHAAMRARARVEPWLDPSARRTDGMPPRSPRSPPSVAVWRRWLAMALVGAVVVGLLLLRQPISEWLWPDTRIQQLRTDAARALQAGELSRADGLGARELYEAALALDPDRDGARDGLVRVGDAALAQAQTAIEQDRLDDARNSLQLARELAMPRARVDALAARLREREHGATGVDRLLSAAAAARSAGRLEGGPDTALALFERALALQPNNVSALEGREDTLADLLQQSRRAMDDGGLTRAATLVERVQAADPGHVDLPQTLAILGTRIEQRLRKADSDLRRGRLAQALDGYRQIGEIDPENMEAARGRVRVANAHATRSRRHSADLRIRQAQSELLEAQAIAPDAPAVVAARQHLAEARLLQARLHSDLPPARRKQRVQELLQAAGAAEARGDLLLPPGDSAYDKLRTARAIAPSDPAVIAMAARLRPAAHACFERALRGNRLTTAGGCLDAYALLEGEDGIVRSARRQLALRWIAVGDERLGAGELQSARHALDTARSLDPAADGLQAFSRRVSAASLSPPAD